MTLPPPVRAARMMATVRKLATGLVRRLPRHVDVEDLVGAGSLGLADAFTRRGPMPGAEFEAFASHRIRGAMLDELRRQDTMTRRGRRNAKRVAQASRIVEQKLGRPAREEEVAEELGLDVEAFQALRTKIDATRVVRASGGDDNHDEDGVQELPDPTGQAPDVIAARMQLGAQVADKIAALSPRTQAVLLGVYVEGATLKELGRTMGVSESRVCQIHSQALTALRAMLGATEDDLVAKTTHKNRPLGLQASGMGPFQESRATAASGRTSRAA